MCVLFLALLCANSCLVASRTVHVDASLGNDSGTGSSEDPLASLHRAVQVGSFSTSGKLLIVVNPGIYTGPLNSNLSVSSNITEFTLTGSEPNGTIAFRVVHFLSLNCSNITIENVQFMEAQGTPIHIVSAVSVVITNISCIRVNGTCANVTARTLNVAGSSFEQGFCSSGSNCPSSLIANSNDNVVLDRVSFFNSSTVAMTVFGNSCSITRCLFSDNRGVSSATATLRLFGDLIVKDSIV
jgi:hypothetical protein